LLPIGRQVIACTVIFLLFSPAAGMSEVFIARPSAGLLRRLAALVYDGFLLFAITLAYAGTVLLVRIWLTGVERAQTPYTGPSALLMFIGLWFCLSLFYCWCWRRSGQTLGMKTWRLQLQQVNGELPSWRQCWLRSALAPLSLSILGIGYLWCLAGSGDCLHDSWSKTRVVILPKNR
jgi:uncharacterized RDD family membrane protein YckC